MNTHIKNPHLPKYGEDRDDAIFKAHKAYARSANQIVATRSMMVRELNLPVHIVDAIFDYAEYWASVSTEVNYTDVMLFRGTPKQIHGQGDNHSILLLRSFPLGLGSYGQSNDSTAEEWQQSSTPAYASPLKVEHDPGYFHAQTKNPTPRLQHPARKIVFRFKSRDQGWGGAAGDKGSYNGSYTWFDVGLERFDRTAEIDCTPPYYRTDGWDPTKETPCPEGCWLPLHTLRPVLPAIKTGENTNIYDYIHPLGGQDESAIQKNMTATRDVKEHIVEWRWTDDVAPDSEEGKKLVEGGRGSETLDGRFVRDLKLGDVVTVWGKARFGGWVNFVDKVSMEIYWAV